MENMGQEKPTNIYPTVNNYIQEKSKKTEEAVVDFKRMIQTRITELEEEKIRLESEGQAPAMIDKINYRLEKLNAQLNMPYEKIINIKEGPVWENYEDEEEKKAA